MERRALLGLAGSVVFGGPAVAHPTPSPTRTPARSPSTTATGSPTGSATATGEADDDGVRATPAGYGPLGTTGLPGAKEAVVGPDGTTVFVAVTDGFAVVDAGDPTNPRVIHENRSVLSDVADGPLTQVFDAKVDGDRLAVTGPANPGTDGLRAVAVFDVSDPAAPSRVSYHTTEYFNHNCFVSDGVVYLCGNHPASDRPNALVTVDAESGDELGRWSIVEKEPGWSDVHFELWVLHDVWVADGIAYLAHWDAGTWMVDVTDPADPRLLAKVRGRSPDAFADLSTQEKRVESTEAPGNDHFVRPGGDGDLLAIGVEAWDVTPDDGERDGPGGIHLYDVSTPADPDRLAFVEPPPAPDPSPGGVWTTSHNFDIVGDLLYSSWYRGGVRVFDVSTPSRPELLTAWRNDATTSFWTAQRADGFVVASSRKDPGDETSTEPTEGAALYTFPEPGAIPSSGADPGGSRPHPTTSPSPGAPPTARGNRTDRDGGTPAKRGETAADAPGFGASGALVAMAGAGLGAWRYLRQG